MHVSAHSASFDRGSVNGSLHQQSSLRQRVVGTTKGKEKRRNTRGGRETKRTQRRCVGLIADRTTNQRQHKTKLQCAQLDIHQNLVANTRRLGSATHNKNNSKNNTQKKQTRARHNNHNNSHNKTSDAVVCALCALSRPYCVFSSRQGPTDALLPLLDRWGVGGRPSGGLRPADRKTSVPPVTAKHRATLCAFSGQREKNTAEGNTNPTERARERVGAPLLRCVCVRALFLCAALCSLCLPSAASCCVFVVVGDSMLIPLSPSDVLRLKEGEEEGEDDPGWSTSPQPPRQQAPSLPTLCVCADTP